MSILKLEAWKNYLERYPEAHLLQTAEWGALKADFGWQPVWISAGDVGAQVLFRSLPLGYSLAYIPKGPLGSDWGALWPEVDALCRQRKAVFLKVEPDAWDGDPVEDLLAGAGFRPSAHEIQPRRTFTIDISGDEDQILAAMKQKTRYNIRLAARKGVTVAASSNLEEFGQLMDVTGERDAFGVHTLDYYRRAYELFHPAGKCELLIASFEDQPLAGVMVFKQGKRAWYLYGASNNLQRNLMPTYLVQWEAIRWAKEQGCTEYDLWGVPDAEQQVLEETFMQRSDGLWGVYRFKRGFGGALKRSAGAWDKVYKPAVYLPYRLLMARRGE
ncbi:MAG: peptidoglycan bridge formation glycyltransferase FemA/FemB family protein [Chloroflexota bacterium]